MIQHPVRGKIPFHLFPYQEDTLTQFKDCRYNIVLKSRQTGISTLVAGFSLWKMLFNQDFNVLVIATKQEVAKNLVTKVRVMNQYLPSWLKWKPQKIINYPYDTQMVLRLKQPQPQEMLVVLKHYPYWYLMRQLSLIRLKRFGYLLNLPYQRVVTQLFFQHQMV